MALSVAAVILSSCGLTGIGSRLVWIEQHPKSRPSGLVGAPLAYDSATRVVVLLGAPPPPGPLYDPTSTWKLTWTWNGTDWTEQHPANSPPPRRSASMAYDAATHQIVLFGGVDLCEVHQRRGCGASHPSTWTWNGETWTKQHPTQNPPSRILAQMAYDAATHQVVLFGGFRAGGSVGELDDTWTWDGTNWTEQHPAQSPPPLAGASMAYDAAMHQVVLFGGGPSGPFRNLDDTWTWDGTTWTEQHPAQSPPGTQLASMAYDAATHSILLFGGLGKSSSETWTLRLNEALKGAARS